MLVLVGMMGSGKSSVGRRLALALGVPSVDLDREIERNAKLRVADIFARYGESHFRKLEEQEMLRCSQSGEPVVLSLGGGSVLSERGMQALKSRGKVVYLRTSVPQLVERLRASRTRRPLIMSTEDPGSKLEEILEKRKSLYERYADLIVDTDGKTPLESAEEILAWWRKQPK